MKIKADEKNEDDIPFKKTRATIVSTEDIETKKFGDKVKANLNNEEFKDFSVFVNNTSLNNLIEAYGNDDENWVGKVVELTKNVDETFKSDMIVLNPVK